MLTTLRVGRQAHVDGRAAVVALLDRETAVQRPHPRGDRVEALPPALAGRVVGDDRVEAPVLGSCNPNRDPFRRPTPDGLVERLADDLVDARLRLLGERLSGLHLDVDL